MTNWRELCAELCDDLEEWVDGFLINDPPDEFTAATQDRINRARALLDQPEPEVVGPQPSPVPVPVAERPWEREGWCNAEGRCWFLREICGDLAWELEDPSSTITFGRISCLPHNALPVPGAEVG